MPLPHKPGTLSPVIYFLRADGHVILAPYTDAPTPNGHIRCEAGSLPEIDRLQSKLNTQCRAEFDAEMEADDALVFSGRQKVRDKLYQIMTSSSTSAAERDFIAAYLQLREEKRERVRAKAREYTTFLPAREMDLHGRDPNVERAPE